MWIMTTYGFFSIVDHGEGGLTVRARDKESLVEMGKLVKIGPIDENSDRDYVYRTVVAPEELATWLCAEMASIDYPNFKDAVKARGGKRAHTLAQYFGRIWDVLSTFGAGAYGSQMTTAEHLLAAKGASEHFLEQWRQGR